MIYERIRSLREQANMSQAELARRLGVTRASVNAWESGVSSPTAAYLVDLARLFHVRTDYILGLEDEKWLNISRCTEEESHILYSLLRYFDEAKA